MAFFHAQVDRTLGWSQPKHLRSAWCSEALPLMGLWAWHQAPPGPRACAATVRPPGCLEVVSQFGLIPGGLPFLSLSLTFIEI